MAQKSAVRDTISAVRASSRHIDRNHLTHYRYGPFEAPRDCVSTLRTSRRASRIPQPKAGEIFDRYIRLQRWVACGFQQDPL